MEEWKTIPSYPDYEASSMGYIRNKKTKKTIKHNYNGGYAQMHLYKDKKRDAVKLHRMIAEAFHPNPEKKATVNHIDKDTTNNKPSNLEWSTQQENNEHKIAQNFQRKELTTRKVWKCCKDTNEKLACFESTQIAARSIDDSNWKGISCKINLVLNGHRQSAYGFCWEYEDEPDIHNEEWKELPPTSIDGAMGYMVSSHGRLKNDKNKHFKGHVTQQDYVRVSINEKLYRMHQLVACAFHPNPENKPHVNHKDGNRSNNHVDNLEWCTRSENMQHAYDTGLNTKVKKRD